MITLADPQEQQRVIDAIKAANQGESATTRLGLFLDAGGGRGLEDLSPLWEKGEWGQTDLPLTLDATIAGYLPNRFIDARVRLITEVEGVPVEQLSGQKTALEAPQDAYSTELLSSSAGSLATGNDAIKLRFFTQYPGWAPDQVVVDAAQKLPYRQNRVYAEKIQNVRVSYAGSGDQPGFVAGEPVGAIFSRLGTQQTIGYIFRDTNYGGLRATVPKPLSSGAPRNAASRFRTYESTQFPAWDKQRPTPPTERYSEVRVYQNDKNGRVLYEEFAEIQYPPYIRRPHKDRFLNIAFEETPGEGDREGARSRALEEAARQGRMLLVGPDLTLPAYDPLMESEDPLWISDIFRNYDGTYEALWRMEVKTFKHTFGGTGAAGGTLDTTVAYEATLLNFDKVATPNFIGPHANRTNY